MGLYLLPVSSQDRDRSPSPSFQEWQWHEWGGFLWGGCLPSLVWYFCWLWCYSWSLQLGSRNLMIFLPGLGRLPGGKGHHSSGQMFYRALLLILGINLKGQITEHANKLQERKMNTEMKRSKRQRIVKSRQERTEWFNIDLSLGCYFIWSSCNYTALKF